VWQSATVAALGILVGIPAGIVIGRVAWTNAVDHLGMEPGVVGRDFQDAGVGGGETAVVERAAVPQLDDRVIDAALASFLGEQQQVPPMHSALKFEGKRLYELARRGESVEREPRRIFIHRIARVRLERAELEFDVYCSKGTYIRTLAGDVANRLGTLGYVRGLRRLTLDPFDDLPMYTMEQLAERSHAARDEVLLPSDRAFPDLPRVDLDPGAVAALLQGRTVAARQRAAPGELRAYDDGGRFLGVVQGAPEGRVRPVRLFVDVAAS